MKRPEDLGIICYCSRTSPTWPSANLSFSQSFIPVLFHSPAVPAYDLTLPPTGSRLRCTMRQAGRCNKDGCGAPRGRPLGEPVASPRPWLAPSFHGGTDIAVCSARLTPWQPLCLCRGRSFARWLKCSCSYFVLMQTDISSSSRSGFLL